jgi:hypothetical protein
MRQAERHFNEILPPELQKDDVSLPTHAPRLRSRVYRSSRTSCTHGYLRVSVANLPSAALIASFCSSSE